MYVANLSSELRQFVMGAIHTYVVWVLHALTYSRETISVCVSARPFLKAITTIIMARSSLVCHLRYATCGSWKSDPLSIPIPIPMLHSMTWDGEALQDGRTCGRARVEASRERERERPLLSPSPRIRRAMGTTLPS